MNCRLVTYLALVASVVALSSCGSTGGVVVDTPVVDGTLCWGSDGSFAGKGAPKCIQFTDSSGNPVGGPLASVPGGSIPEGAVGFHGVECPRPEGPPLAPGPGVGGGASDSTGTGQGGPAAWKPHPGASEFTIAGAVVGDLSHVVSYRIAVTTSSHGVAEQLAAQYAATLHVEPSSSPAPPTAIDFDHVVGVRVAEPSASEGLVYGLAEEPFDDWEVTVNGVVLADGPRLQLASGLWMASSLVPMSMVDTTAGASNEVAVAYEAAGEPTSVELVYGFDAQGGRLR